MSASREETIVDPEWENFFREKGQRQRTLRHLLGEMPVFSLSLIHISEPTRPY